MATSLNSDLLGHTMLFPCSAGVHITSLEAGSSKVKADLANSQMPNQFPMAIITRDEHPVSKRYLGMVSKGLTFSNEVIEDRCLHMMPYSEKYFAGIFEPGELKFSSKKVSTVDSYKKRRAHAHHSGLNLKTISKPKCLISLEPLGKTKALHLHKQAPLASLDAKRSKNTNDLNPSDSRATFMTEIRCRGGYKSNQNLRPLPEKETEVQHSCAKNNIKFLSEFAAQSTQNPNVAVDVKDESISKLDNVPDDRNKVLTESRPVRRDWDDHLLSKLSQQTANWIVHECMPADPQKDKLLSILKSWYGDPINTDLLREDISDGDEEDKKENQKPKKKWKKAEASLLARVYNITPPPAEAIDPYSDNNRAPFYRQPAGVRKKKRISDQDGADAVNTTAHNISIRPHVEIPQPKLKDFLNPHVGDKIYETDNLYQQEWLTGKSHIYNSGGDPAEILMETENKFKKQLQREMPLKPDMWYRTEGDKTKEQLSSSNFTFHKPKRGRQKRWIALPQPMTDTEQLMTIASTEFDSNISKTGDTEHRQKIRQNHALVSIVRDWRSKWFLCGQYVDSTPDDLIKDMADIQPHVRLKAIGTVAKAAEYKPSFNGSILDSNEQDSVHELPEKIFIALECLLDDSHDQVRKAAAITLYTLERPNDKAKAMLREMLVSESKVVRWTSAHCLAHYGECDSDIVAEVIKQILSTESAIKYEQGIYLLAKISHNGNIVHCMVAEQLNSSIWRHRMIACKILSTLFGPINRDITQKLSHMMWHDWHAEVRNAAAQCLGKTSHGRDVHDGIKDKLLHGTDKIKFEAISKLGQLGIMTAKLLPAFLLCFANNHVSIRCEVCIACGNLQIKEEQVINHLVHLATLDTSWRVKALAIQALGKIGEVNDEIKECLLWAVRYEEMPGVRAEACHSLVTLNICDEDVINTLQERFLVESSKIVKEELIEALSLFGLNITEDSELMVQIKSEVRKLCKHSVIASQIIINEMDDTKQAQLKKMVFMTDEDVEALNKKRAEMLETIRSQAKKLDSRKSSSKPRTSTPLSRIKTRSDGTTPELLSSRDGTDFASTVDKELEALISHDKSESWSVSSKSLALTGEFGDSEEEKYVTGTWQKDYNAHSVMIQTDTNEEEETMTHVSSREDIEGGGEISDKSANLRHYLSLPQSVPATSSQDSLPSLSVSSRDLKRPSSPFAQFYDRRLLMSKDVMKEKERFNKEVSAVYLELDTRYAGLSKDLIKIDLGYNTREFSADSDINYSNAAMSTDDIQIFHSGIKNHLSRNGETSTILADTVGQDTEIHETLPGSTEINKVTVVGSDTEIHETLPGSTEINKVTVVGSYTEIHEILPGSTEINKVIVVGQDTEIHETLPESTERNKVTVVGLHTEIHETLPGSTEINKVIVVGQDTEIHETLPGSTEINKVTVVGQDTEIQETLPESAEINKVTVVGQDTEIHETLPGSAETSKATDVGSDTEIQETLPESAETSKATDVGSDTEIQETLPGSTQINKVTDVGSDTEIHETLPGSAETSKATVVGSDTEIHETLPGSAETSKATDVGSDTEIQETLPESAETSKATDVGSDTEIQETLPESAETSKATDVGSDTEIQETLPESAETSKATDVGSDTEIQETLPESAETSKATDVGSDTEIQETLPESAETSKATDVGSDTEIQETLPESAETSKATDVGSDTEIHETLPESAETSKATVVGQDTET